MWWAHVSGGEWWTLRSLVRRTLIGGVLCALVKISGCGSSGSQRAGPSGRVYRAQAVSEPVSAAILNKAIEVIRNRTTRLGVASEIERSGTDEIVVTLPDVANAPQAQEEVGQTAQLFFYDWEPNVIGPKGQPAPTEGTVTGDASSTGAGGVSAGLTEYQAVQRAAKRPPLIRPNDTTLTPGCTPAQIGGCVYGGWYLLGGGEQVLGGPENTKKALYTENYERQTGATWRAVHVNPGTVLIQARPAENAKGEVVNASPNSWYVMNDDPILSGADITNPQQSTEQAPGGEGLPSVVFGFTPHSKNIFERMTRELARRGKEAQLPGVSKEEAEQHFAVALDDKLLTVPSINYAKYPNGFASATSEISGTLTVLSAQNLAN
jgi:SecD/SecF fusion protein